MAIHDLPDQFATLHDRIALGDRAIVAIAAHIEVRSVLGEAAALRSHGLADVLIGSYARRVSIWPGKDVDVFGRLSGADTASMHPDLAYSLFEDSLHRYAVEDRLRPQARSLNVDFSPTRLPGEQYVRAAAAEYRWNAGRVNRVIRDLGQYAFEFSVDVVPAVTWGDHYGIPEVELDRVSGQRNRTGRWRRTNPVELTSLTRRRNRDPRVGSVGAYVRTVKAIKQVKAHHLEGIKPSALFYEFLLYDGFSEDAIRGDSWADITASALEYIVTRLRSLAVRPVVDPVLRQEYAPAPPADDLAIALARLEDVSRRANSAVAASSRCQAAIQWRSVFGANPRHDHVFPLPPGCRGTGTAMGAAAANVAVGGTAERSFGDR